jgi:hypothetical protein
VIPRRTAWLALLAGALPFAALAAAPAGVPAGYQLALPGRIELDEGQGGAVSLAITPDPGYAISRAGPLRIALAAEPGDGLELPRRRYQRGHAADREAAAPRFDLAVRAARAGRYRLAIDVDFWLCRSRGRTCRPVRASRSVAIDVRAPPPPERPDQR